MMRSGVRIPPAPPSLVVQSALREPPPSIPSPKTYASPAELEVLGGSGAGDPGMLTAKDDAPIY